MPSNAALRNASMFSSEATGHAERTASSALDKVSDWLYGSP